MHAKSAEVTQFLDKDLLPQVKQAFGLYKTADKAELEKELDQGHCAGVRRWAWILRQSPKVKELRSKLANDAVDVGALENEVYDHLFSFFRRYYSEGDFLAKRVYKPASTPSPMRARRSSSTGPTATSTTSRPASTCATTPSACGRTTTKPMRVHISGWWMRPKVSMATSRPPKARTAFSS